MDEEEFQGFPAIDSIVMNAGHALIMSNKPAGITGDMVQKKAIEEKRDTASFGLFDRATPNYTTYYPDLKVEDLQPKDSEFIEPLFRMLSKTVVHRQFNPIDFGKGNVLKNSMQLLVGQAVNVDHETALGNAIGSVKEVTWQNEYTTDDGITVPAGFNAVLKIDGKANPRIARGVMMDPPSIHSNSVTVRFKWEQSHLKMAQNEFYSKLGTFDEDGEMIRRVVTEVVSYAETSLVGHGADPFAQIIKDGKISNPKFAEIQDSFSALKMEAADVSSYWVDYKDDVVSNSSTQSATLNFNNNNQNQLHMKKEDFLKLASVIGLAEGTDFTEENFSEVITEAFNAKSKEASDALTAQETAEGKVTELEGTVTNHTTEKGDLETQVTELTANAGVGETALSETREEVTRLYKLAVGEDNVDAGILAVMEKADYTTSKAFHKQYKDAVDEKFEIKCNSCDSTDVNRMSAKVDDPSNNGGGTHKELTNAEVRFNLRESKRKSNAITSEEAE